MAKAKPLKKPAPPSSAAILAHAQGTSRRQRKPVEDLSANSRWAPEGMKRLTANVREDLHLRLRLAAARDAVTIGSIIEALVERHVPKE